MTPQERAAVQYTMNDLFRMAMDGKVNIVEDKFVYASALQQTRRAALLEVAELHQEWRNGKHSGTFSDLLRHKLAQEG